ncbi:hypothetical protein AAL_01048 [Moelleriella libera RCEF 2490]|uniref:Mucoidy inhibitor-like protein n=1 Tax=Moelleriella libera RCEF 2490 TaxID=1081109 RepID=A0A166VEU9_9HYPO|nr:hypothetical protein AAL_01048 [Moelleriella libera RCEF 2490]
MDSINKIEYKLRDLCTRSVTLFPSRAQIQRDIKNVPLTLGTNEVTILGLSPTVDKDSIKVEGGAAFTISDVFVESLPNREIFEDVYPDDSDADDSSDEDDDDLMDERRWKEHAELKAAKRKLEALEDARRLANETVTSAESRLKLLDAYGNSLDKKRGVVIEEALETYKQQRSKAYEDYMNGLKEQRIVTEEIENQEDEVYRLQKEDDKAQARDFKEKDKIYQAKQKDLLKKRRRREEERNEKERIRKEREKFWPKICYAVKITLETDTITPVTSRRTSMSSETGVFVPAAAHDAPAESKEAETAHTLCDLALSYVTSSAYWVPTYDLQLSTTSATGTLSFDAELHNTTSETWLKSKVVLSTSQATFAGLEDEIPSLNPWYMTLFQATQSQGHNQAHDRVARSNDEIVNTNKFMARQKQSGPQIPRSEMFGVSPDAQFASLPAQRVGMLRKLKQAAGSAENVGFGGPFDDGPVLFGGAPAPAPPPQAPAPAGFMASQQVQHRGLFGNTNVTTSGFGSGPNLFAQRADDQPGEKQEYEQREQEANQEEADEVADSIMEETGLTTTFELPGLKTLMPKSNATKQRVANIRFANIAYSHTVVAKYKPAAYLKAKFKNTSKMTLFKGRAGLTLDGSFMGRTSLPRCSAGETLSLSLGIDPAIKVTYPKPVIQRATAGLFSKENTAVFTRSITLHNTRASAEKAISLLVLDQVPVSQDERLKVEVLTPQGMSLGGADVKAGGPGLDTKDGQDWGGAKARLNKGGEVNWRVSLNPGKAVRLALEYGIAFPMGYYPV